MTDKWPTMALTFLLSLDLSILAWVKVIPAEMFGQCFAVLIVAVFTGEIAGPLAGAVLVRAKAVYEETKR